jgi:putative membrane protein
MSATALAQSLIVLACALTLWRMTRELPLQNVLACAGLIAVLSGVIEIIAVKTGIPFGSFIYTENLGYRLFHLLPWPVPLFWIIILLNSRSFARLILRRSRERKNNGLWVIALAAVLATAFDAVLEAMANANHWWFWGNSTAIFSLSGAPWTNYVAWLCTSLYILISITPWLLNKRTAWRTSDRQIS